MINPEAETQTAGLPRPPYEDRQFKSVRQQTKTRKKKDAEPTFVQSCEYEVFGILRDVSFRTYTLRRAQKLEVRGWCMQTERNTVAGVIQGYPKGFEAMRLWLTYTGSPTSRIDKCIFGPVKMLEEFTFSKFSIVSEAPV